MLAWGNGCLAMFPMEFRRSEAMYQLSLLLVSCAVFACVSGDVSCVIG